MSIVIEDIGVRLQPVKGSHALVRADTAERSSDLKKYSAWVKVEKFDVVPTKGVVKAVSLHDSRAADSPPPNADMEKLMKSIADMNERQKQLFEMLAAALVPASGSFHANRVESHRILVESIEDEPIILPEKIIPDSVSVQARESELEIDDFDLIVRALRKAKK